jgi:hypothetical protein
VSREGRSNESRRKRTHLEQIAREIFGIIDFENNLLALLGDGASGLDLVVLVATRLAVGRHDDDVLAKRKRKQAISRRPTKSSQERATD